jgi:hypothetical protein
MSILQRLQNGWTGGVAGWHRGIAQAHQRQAEQTAAAAARKREIEGVVTPAVARLSEHAVWLLDVALPQMCPDDKDAAWAKVDAELAKMTDDEQRGFMHWFRGALAQKRAQAEWAPIARALSSVRVGVLFPM